MKKQTTNTIPGDFSAEFLQRSLRMTALLLLIGSLFTLYQFGAWPAMAVLSGGVWSLINMLFLRATVVSALNPNGIDKLAVLGMLLIKFPALYVCGYFLLALDKFQPLHLMIGFSVFFVVIILKSIGRALLKMDSSKSSARRESILN